uniref:Potassium channel subfamily K member 18 n=1 Tax=Bursaphelenchus xylophilus TaxID=6326 RepID=A0A1I7RZJ2_BURXY
MLAKQILPHIGLCLLLLVYLLLGAAIFQRIEGPNEIIVKRNEISRIRTLKHRYQESVWNLTHNPGTVFSKTTFNALGEEYFEKLVQEIFSSYRNQFVTEVHLLNRTSEDDNLWSYRNSIFFATTVITTIGYGHLVPVTQTGRIACIIFALIGIPLLLVTIADIGRFLSEFLNVAHISSRKFISRIRDKTNRISHRISRFSIRRRLSTDNSKSIENSSMTTDQAGSMNLNEIPPNSEDEDEEEPMQNDAQSLRIPILMVLVVILSYTALGGLLFQKYEGWPYLEAFYFCFITMATIGFGDYVPSMNMNLAVAMTYIIFGLALATMCIDTAGTHYIRKIHYVGTKMEDARGVVMTGIHQSEHLIKHKGINIIRTAGGRIYRVRGHLLSRTESQQLDYLLKSTYYQKNIIYEPLSPQVLKLCREKGIKILPDEISPSECTVLPNHEENLKMLKEFVRNNNVMSPNTIHRTLAKNLDPMSTSLPPMPFVLKESFI